MHPSGWHDLGLPRCRRSHRRGTEVSAVVVDDSVVVFWGLPKITKTTGGSLGIPLRAAED